MIEGHKYIYRAPDTGLTGMKGEISQQNYIDFIFELYSKDIPLSPTQLQLLHDNKLIDIDSIIQKTKFTGDKSIEDVDKSELIKNLPKKRNSYDPEEKLDISEDVFETDVKKKKIDVTNRAEVCVTKEDWMPYDIVDHNKNFVDWINSINSGFQNRIRYDKFELYKLQEEQWRSDKFTIEDIDDEELRYEYMMREFERCSINTLYAANKYYWLKDEKSDSGKIKYFAHNIYEHQKVCFYLFDCGYSIIIGKPRQPGITSTFGIAGMNRCLHKKNYFLKFIAEDKLKSEEIFEDKIKFSFYSLEGWFQPQSDGKPDVVNDRDGLFRIGRRGHKGKVFGANSKIQVTPPYKTAINGGTPPLVFVDEIGSIAILTEMINEGRPTMFRRDPVTGDFEIKGQLVLWGTGTLGKGGGSFENEWKRINGLWNEKEFSVGIIPLFLDWTTRCDKKEYESQKKYYYGSRAQEIGIDEETSRVQFHQHYPTTPDDMFATTQKTLIGREKCDVEIKKINNLDPLIRPTHGYLIPIFDKTKPLGENFDIPFKIVGSDFVPTEEFAEESTTIIFQRPKPRWINRYYQGTDPISADTGMAKMSSSIWDKYYNTISALTNFRKANDPNYSFLQCMLLGLYYDPVYNIGVPELIEKNIGLAYKNYKQERGLYRNLIFSAELPDYLRGPSDSDIGIDNKGNRAKAIVNKMHELFTNFGDRIYISTYFEQLKTFICKITRSGNETWESVDKRYYFDDSLFSAVYAYIGAESYVYKIPKNLDAEIKNQKVLYVNDYDRDYNMIRRPVRMS